MGIKVGGNPWPKFGIGCADNRKQINGLHCDLVVAIVAPVR